MKELLQTILSFLDPFLILLFIVLMLIANNWIFSRIKAGESNGNIIKRSISFILILGGALAFILSLPIAHELKGQILSFLGIIISAGIALSSTTVLGNLIAGIMNNSVKRFRNGDLIKIGEFHGRVIKKKVFHTEIQLEDSNFIIIPNLYIASNPVKLYRKSKTVISTTVSLGYDVPRSVIESALKEAAAESGLKDPYVYIMNLGDYSVVYKIHGFLEDGGKFFTTTSMLNAKVIDALHSKEIEIVSPTFMNQRRIDKKVFISKKQEQVTSEISEALPEELIFDEAIKSEEIENKKDALDKIEDKLDHFKEKLKESKEEEDIEKTKVIISRLEELQSKIKKQIEDETL